MKTIGSSMLLMAAAGGGGLPAASAANFGDDLAFLKKNTDIIVLTDKAGDARVAVAPAWQGRVMTSTATGDSGLSFGWINRDLIASKTLEPHINVFGGEDRFWMGPEGGQYSIFFAKGAPFEFAHWFTPAPLDTEPFTVVKSGTDKAAFRHQFTLTNYSGTIFHVKVDREVRLLDAKSTWSKLGLPVVSGLKMVAFESANKISNAGRVSWEKQSGLVSIWILGMFNPSPATTIVVPIKPGPETELGKAVTADYFGQVPPDRLVVQDRIIFFSGDGKYRSKIGISPQRCVPLIGSYDAANQVLTLAKFSFKAGTKDYVNSLWKLQDNPYGGDVANSYNDGPVVPGGKPLGPFYELESSSPAAALAPGKSLEHLHTTVHLSGDEKTLDAVAQAAFGVSLKDIKAVFAK